MSVLLKMKMTIKVVFTLSFLAATPYLLFFVSGAFCDCTNVTSPNSIILPNTPNTRPECRAWYTIHQEETQWDVVEKYATNNADKQEWLKSMRYMSHKSPEDQHLRPDETVCVRW